MAYLDQYNLAITPDFFHRVEVAMLTAAVAVMAESKATAGHDIRAAFANIAITYPEQTALRVALVVVTNVAITGGSTDDNILFAVNSLWDALSGYSPNA